MGLPVVLTLKHPLAFQGCASKRLFLSSVRVHPSVALPAQTNFVFLLDILS